MLFLWCKAEFSSLLQFSVSHDLLEIITIYLTQETFLIIIIINVENIIFCVKMMHFIFQDFLINVQFNEQHLSNILIKFVYAFIK